ncbi:MAG: hypothetical protein P4N59_22140 [Negativicutes bacterium]|nr:hypothetical protein [Negativicutes bacterium]
MAMLACVVLTGCGWRHRRNIKAEHEIAEYIYLYCNQDYDSTNGFPAALSDLVSVGIYTNLPQCECADGTNRDFIYIPGFHGTPYGNVFLASPPEMDKDVTIVCFGGEKPKILSRSEAVKEIEKSRALVKVLNNPVKPYKDDP